MATKVLIDVSLLAQRLIPDDTWLKQDIEREFAWVFPGALATMAIAADPEGTKILEQLLRAYREAAETSRRADGLSSRLRGKNKQKDGEPPAADVARFFDTLSEEELVSIYSPGEESPAQSEKAPWLEQQPPDSKQEEDPLEARWIKSQLEDKHLRYHLRKAYESQLGLEPHPLLDQYFYEMLAGLTVGEAQSPRERFLLASVGRLTLDILSQAVGALIFEVGDAVGSIAGDVTETVRDYVDRNRRFFAELVPQALLAEVINRGLNLLTSGYFDPTPEALLAAAVTATGLFMVVNGSKPVAGGRTTRRRKTGYLLGSIGAFALALIIFACSCYRDALCDLLCAERPEIFAPTSLPVSAGPTVLTVTPKDLVVGPPGGAEVTATLQPPMIIIVPCSDCSAGCNPNCMPSYHPEVHAKVHPFGEMDYVMPHTAGYHGAYVDAVMPAPYDSGYGGSTAYIVQPGDTVYGLARRFDTSPQAISSSNYLPDPNYIRVGQVLYIP